jgi:alpha-beta hydrolase superfamily lysophospholipase
MSHLAAPDALTPHTSLDLNRYTRWMHRVDRLSRWLGLQVHVRGHVANLERGDIFLFNHFTRFETAVPPYLLFRNTGAICRSVAHHSLFRVHPLLTKLLNDAGAVPSNMPGLLPFLAKEILRGRKVIIFPEGGLIKDKQVLDAHGDYGVFSDSINAFRKHHRGAAVLATYLDILKHHLRDILARNDDDAIAHWLRELELSDREALLQAVGKPTLVVPNTITFFPIRSEGNSLTRLLGGALGELPDDVVDEVATETNLLFRPTDMDVTVGDALPTLLAPQRGESLIWRHGLRHAQSVDDIFNLEFGQANWLQPILQRRINLAIGRLRDRTMRALYAGLTINLHHVVAQVVHELQARGQVRVPAPEFHQALFWALSRLREHAAHNPQLMLHASITDPHIALEALNGRGHRLVRFLEMLRKARLFKLKGRGEQAYYILSHRLDDMVMHEDVRLEHPVRLHVNEAASQPIVRLAARWALGQTHKASATAKARAMFAAMQESWRYAFAHSRVLPFAHPMPHDAGLPRLLEPTQSNGQGVMLVHGLSASPAQLLGIAKELKTLGFTVLMLRLPGHGTAPSALQAYTHQDWTAEATRGIDILEGLGLKVSVIGFSTGALIALRLGQLFPNRLSRIVAAAPPLQLVNRLRHLLVPALVLNRLVRLIPLLGRRLPLGIIRWYYTHTREPEFCYDRLPLRAVRELQLLAHEVQRHAAATTLPTLVLQGSADDVANPTVTQQLAHQLPQARLVMIEQAGHLIVSQNVLNSWAHIHAFLAEATHA